MLIDRECVQTLKRAFTHYIERIKTLLNETDEENKEIILGNNFIQTDLESNIVKVQNLITELDRLDNTNDDTNFGILFRTFCENTENCKIIISSLGCYTNDLTKSMSAVRSKLDKAELTFEKVDEEIFRANRVLKEYCRR